MEIFKELIYVVEFFSFFYYFIIIICYERWRYLVEIMLFELDMIYILNV